MNFIVGLIVIFLLIAILTKRPVVPKSRWSHHFDFQFSGNNFYTQVEEAIRQRKLPNLSFSRTLSPETGMFSARREYLTITRGEYVFDVCAAPYGTGFFISWWLGEKEDGIMSRIPLLNKLPGSRRNKTYYQVDVETMFKSAVHTAILSVIDNMTNTQGVRPLTELERQAKDK